jgi:hypothetical protein
MRPAVQPPRSLRPCCCRAARQRRRSCSTCRLTCRRARPAAAAPAGAGTLGLRSPLQLRAQSKIEQAPRKVPSVEQLAQGDAPTVPSREFSPPKSLDEQLGSAEVPRPAHAPRCTSAVRRVASARDESAGAPQASGKLSLPDPLKTMEAPGGANSFVQQLQEQVRGQLEKTKEAVAENLPGPKDLGPGALRDRVVGEALTSQSPAVQMQR